MARKVGISAYTADLLKALPYGVISSFYPPSGSLDDYFDTTTGLPLISDLDEWVLMDGNNSTTDSSGRYLRGCEDNITAGSTKGYETALPVNSFSISSESHTHIYYDRYLYKITRSSSDFADSSTASYNTSDYQYIESGADDSTYWYWTSATRTSGDDEHSHTVSGGDDETRPNSIVAVFIIKMEM